MWKEAAVACSNLPYKHLPGGTEENVKHLNQNSRVPGRESEMGPREYEAGAVTATLK